MAHFAQIDENNIVIQVIVVADADLYDRDARKSWEEGGIKFCKKLFGEDTRWVQTSYNSNFRGNYAGIGYSYDESLDLFLPPKPYPSWVVNTETAQWEAPMPHPPVKMKKVWIEETKVWAEVPEQEFIWNEITQTWDVDNGTSD